MPATQGTAPDQKGGRHEKQTSTGSLPDSYSERPPWQGPGSGSPRPALRKGPRCSPAAAKLRHQEAGRSEVRIGERGFLEFLSWLKRLGVFWSLRSQLRHVRVSFLLLSRTEAMCSVVSRILGREPGSKNRSTMPSRPSTCSRCFGSFTRTEGETATCKITIL